MEEARLPTHLEVAGWRRAVEAAGGFAVVLHRGERDAGSILLLTIENGGNPHLWERFPTLDGRRRFTRVDTQVTDKNEELQDYLTRRSTQDPDLWIVELDIVKPERFIDIRAKDI